MNLTSLFWPCVALVGLGQLMILRSTVRALRGAAPGRRGIEWAYAIVPMIVLVLTMLATYRASQSQTVSADFSIEIKS